MVATARRTLSIVLKQQHKVNDCLTYCFPNAQSALTLGVINEVNSVPLIGEWAAAAAATQSEYT